MPANDPFTTHRDAIFMAAAELYRADRAGVDPDPERSRVALPQNLGTLTRTDMGEAKSAEAQVNVAARQVARLAGFEDQIALGGVKGLVGRFEKRLTLLVERRYVRGALKPGGLVEMIRSPDTTLSQ